MPAIASSLPDVVHFPLIVDEKASQDPNATYAILTPASLETTSLKSEITLTWNEFNQAIHRGAHSINPVNPDGSRTTGRVIAILALIDTFVYQTTLLAIARSGNIPFPISHRNSPLAVANLLNKSNCSQVIVGGNATISTLMDHAQAELRGMNREPAEVIEALTVKQLYPNLGDNLVDPLLAPYPMLPEECLQLDSPRLYLHSSGSTSLPKAILLNEQYMRYMGRTSMIRQLATISRLGVMMPPPFHHMGMFSQLVTPFYSLHSSIVMWAPNVSAEGEYLSAPVPNSDMLLESLKRAGCHGSVSVPTFLIDWSKDPEAMSFLKTLDCVFTGGASLPDDVGDTLVANGVKVTIGYGGTEFGLPTWMFTSMRKPDSADWAYLEFAPEAPVRLREHDNGHEILYELIIQAGPTFVPAVVNTTTPDGPGYATSDMWRPHPTKKGLYKIVGRLDDQITLANGEKVNPGHIEVVLVKSSLVEAVTVFGRERTQIGILVEPTKGHEIDPRDPKALAKYRNDIWSFVETANHESPGFARIFKEAILPTAAGKPLLRTPKGVVSQKLSVKLYEEEIDAIYAEIEKARGGDNVNGPDGWSSEPLKVWLSGLLEELLEHSVDEQKDIFDQGADSLTTTFIRNRIIGALTKAKLSSHISHIDQNIVYAHPSAAALADHLASLFGASRSTPVSADSPEVHIHNMNTLVERYTASLPDISISPTFLPDGSKDTVLVTGTTGALGSLMLAQLLENPRVEKVWAVNRPSRAGVPIAERQRESFADKALDVALLDNALGSGKVTLVEAELSAEKLGLSPELYQELLSTTTLIIHNAWRLDFNLSVLSFEPNIRGSRHLVDLALASPRAQHVRFVFTSSVGAVSGWKDVTKVVPEEPLAGPHLAVGNGYGEGKHVTEEILEIVRKKTGLQTTNIRVGQLSGTQENGFWSATDWVPIMTATSLNLGVFPDAVGGVAWVPLDVAASAVLDVGLQRSSVPEQTVHLYHPRPTPWSQIHSGLSQALSSIVPSFRNQQLALVSFTNWVDILEEKEKNASEADLRRLPALKLIGFFKRLAEGDEWVRKAGHGQDLEALGLAPLGTAKMQAVSPSIRQLASLSVDGSHQKRWIQYWQSKGLF